MFIVYELAICVLAISFGATLLFTACAIFLVLIEGCSFVTQRLGKLRDDALLLQGKTDGDRVSCLLVTVRLS